MAARKNPLTSGNLDALMDTLTNVVGILIIILILVQVSVGQALKKIVSELPEVTAEELQEIRQETAEQLAQHETLKETIDNQRRREPTERTELARLNPQLTTLETSAERSAVPMLDLTTIRGKVLDNSKELDQLRRQSAELLAEQQRLKAALDTTPVVAPPPDKIVRIPNSRPLADNAKMERYLVTPSELYGYDPEGAKKLLLQEFQAARTRLEKEKTKAADGSTQIIYDQEKVVKHFEQKQLMLHGMAIRVPYNQTGTRLTMELAPKPGAGDAVASAGQFGSRFQNDLRRLKMANAVVWFNVTRGSFDAYLQAREICEAVGMSAGWELINNAIYTEPITEFDVNRMVEPAPPRTPDPNATPRPVRATPPPGPKPSPPPPPIRIDPPKKKLD
jgi:hypothetical protein